MSEQNLMNIVDIICHSFRHLDSRLINHGERVSYILMKMLADTNYYTSKEKQNIFILGLLHDIGAYKEDEIDEILSFDINDKMEHSVFGYLLFQKFSPLSDYADIILYHHRCNAQYYPVPISSYHRDIARLIYLADRIDIFCFLKKEENLEAYLEKHNGSLFSPSDIRWFQNADKKYHILEHIYSGEYQAEFTEYTQNYITLTDSQIHNFLMTFIFSMDFRNEYTAMHTSYAVHLSENLANTLNLPSTSCRAIQFAALLHNIGKVSISFKVTNIEDYDRYLKELYQNSTFDITKSILSNAVDEKIIKIIDESFLLLESWIKNKTISFTFTPAAEVVALSYLISNIWTQDWNTSYRKSSKLFEFLEEKYRICQIDDTILLALEKHFQKIMEKTKASCTYVYNTYQNMMEENRYLNTILLHYNNKYNL
ncbi:MAG: HD domain-containing protein [Lachnospiraceae bacterium]